MVEKTILVKESDIMKFGLSNSQGRYQGETLVSPKFPDTNNNPRKQGRGQEGKGGGELCPTTKALSNLNTVCLPFKAAASISFTPFVSSVHNGHILVLLYGVKFNGEIDIVQFILGTSMYYYTACNCTMCNLLLLGKSHFFESKCWPINYFSTFLCTDNFCSKE